MTPSPFHDQAQAEASRWMQNGLVLLERADREAWEEALTCFERAIALREKLPLEAIPLYRWGLTASWMNRGDVLTRLGGPEQLQEALRCYDIAISHLHRLPLEADPLYLWRLSVAWINRGITEQTTPEMPARERALLCFQRALEVMVGNEDSPRVDYQQVQASAWMNHANTLLQLAPPNLGALSSARKAIQHSRTLEEQDRITAEAGIKARHALCRIVAHLLETTPKEKADQADEWIHEATDAVEDVMRLTKDDTTFMPLREDLFHFGCRMYRAFQPHFLAEFLEDGLTAGDMSEAMRQAAQESLSQAALQMQQEKLAGYNPTRLDRLIQTLQSLSEAGKKMGFQSMRPSELD